METLLISLTVAAFTILAVWLILSKKLPQGGSVDGADKIARLETELKHKEHELGELKNQLKEESREKNEFIGKNKQLFAEHTKLQSRFEGLSAERDGLSKELSQFKATEKQHARDLEDKINKLESAKQALEDEKKRIRDEDAERLAEEEANRDRMWAEHEGEVIRILNDICKKPAYAFPTYDNNNLPDGFDAKLKPDFMLDFLGQYVVFDAKVSRSDNLQNYIGDQVKKTAQKFKNHAEIHPVVFLVVPTEAITSLKKLSYYEEGYTFFVVSPEALEPVIASLKQITKYEFAEQMDPQERENIVNLIADFDWHINFRNAFDILAAESGGEILQKAMNLSPDLREEIDQKKTKMRAPSMQSSELKHLMSDREHQQEKIQKLTAPKAQVAREDVEMINSAVEKSRSK